MTNQTMALAEYVAATRPADIPEPVRKQAHRTLLNYLGCALGAARHESVETAARALMPLSGPPTATVIGRGVRCDALLAALLNGMSSSVYSFDDTHAQAVVHPGGPVASAMLALAESRQTSGKDFLTAFALGAEVVCRTSMAISVAPAKGVFGWVQTGIAAGIGAAAGVGKMIGLDAQRLAWAMGIAACQAGGSRALSRSMCFSYMAGQAAQAGLRAALLAEQGFNSGEDSLGGKYGFAELYSQEPHLPYLTEDLGKKFELLQNTFKPYPCGIVIHPAIDACLALSANHNFDCASIAKICIKVNPAAISLCNQPHPKDSFEGQVSMQHWIAAALMDKAGGIVQGVQAKLSHPPLVALRDKILLVGDQTIARDACELSVTLASGEVLTQAVEHCRGSAARPMTDAELERKCRDQAAAVLEGQAIDDLLAACRTLETQSDAATMARLAAGKL